MQVRSSSEALSVRRSAGLFSLFFLFLSSSALAVPTTPAQTLLPPNKTVDLLGFYCKDVGQLLVNSWHSVGRNGKDTGVPIWMGDLDTGMPIWGEGQPYDAETIREMELRPQTACSAHYVVEEWERDVQAQRQALKKKPNAFKRFWNWVRRKGKQSEDKKEALSVLKREMTEIQHEAGCCEECSHENRCLDGLQCALVADKKSGVARGRSF